MTTLEKDKQPVIELLQTAVLFEMSTIPPYMTALLSIKPGTNKVAADNIRGVMMEEMLHMTLAGNVLSSIGGTMTFDANHIPEYPLALEFEGQRLKKREFDIDLAPMSADTIKVFTQIELPDGWPEEKAMLKAVPEIDVPGYTIGAFYQKVEDMLEELCDRYGQDDVFSGDSSRQVDVNFYWSGGGQPIKVSDIKSAKEALSIIVEQGEGTSTSVYDGDMHYFDQAAEVAHFFRFNEILYSRHYQAGDHPHEPPTGDSFEVDYDAVYPIKVNAKASDYADDLKLSQLNQNFNREYSRMLTQIAAAFNGNPDALYTAILNGMHDMVDIAREMMKTPIANDQNGLNGAPSFEWVKPV